MTKEAWKRRLGESAWRFVTNLTIDTLEERDPEEVVAEILTRLYEAGWRGPEIQPVIDPRGTKVMWPSASGSSFNTLTAEGLHRFWSGRGHKWILLRLEQACKAMAGPLMPRFQEVLAAYEAQCDKEQIATLPEWADWVVFVGGESPLVDLTKLDEGFRDGR
jgi:hypothetical protein